jgi:C_GCAxxG_C_C family probable redox protein
MGNNILSRRKFLSGFSCLGVGSCFLNLPPIFKYRQDKKTGLWHAFSPEEKEMINNSELAKLFANIDYNKWSCAESTLLATLRYVNKPEEYVQTAAGFGGGLDQGDLCGMITGGIMGLGVVAHKYLKDSKEIKEYVEYASAEYWNWWKSMAPVRCDELKKRYEGAEKYLRMGKRATSKLDELIQVVKM